MFAGLGDVRCHWHEDLEEAAHHTRWHATHLGRRFYSFHFLSHANHANVFFLLQRARNRVLILGKHKRTNTTWIHLHVSRWCWLSRIEKASGIGSSTPTPCSTFCGLSGPWTVPIHESHWRKWTRRKILPKRTRFRVESPDEDESSVDGGELCSNALSSADDVRPCTPCVKISTNEKNVQSPSSPFEGVTPGFSISFVTLSTNQQTVFYKRSGLAFQTSTCLKVLRRRLECLTPFPLTLSPFVETSIGTALAPSTWSIFSVFVF